MSVVQPEVFAGLSLSPFPPLTLTPPSSLLPPPSSLLSPLSSLLPPPSSLLRPSSFLFPPPSSLLPQVHTLSASNAILKDVTVNIVSSLPLTTHPSHYHLDEVTSSTPSQPHTVTVVCTPTLLPLSHTITISATYATYNGK